MQFISGFLGFPLETICRKHKVDVLWIYPRFFGQALNNTSSLHFFAL